jgi:outer membrane protein assembly factor BamA
LEIFLPLMSFFRVHFLLLLTIQAAVAQTEVRITGMVTKSENLVLGLIGERLEHVRAKPASTSRADDAAFLLRQVLLRDGYAQVQVGYQVVSPSQIILTVREGARLSLGTVTVTGVPAGEVQRFAGLYTRPAEENRPFAAGPPPFREEDIETGLSYIEQDLNAEGFWAAEATLVFRNIDPITGEVNPVINVSAGAMHQIGSALIDSPDGRGVIRTQTSVQPFIGRPATTGNLNAMRLAVEEAFTSRGYPDARITMGRRVEAGRFNPEFFIDLGRRVRLNEIHFEGLERTRPGRVAARFRGFQGEWYDEAAMNRRLRGFLSTGAFASARLETEDVEGKRIDATIHFEEARAREISPAVGFDTYLGALFRTTYTDRNFMGALLGFSVGAEVSARGLLGEVRITDPWLFGTDVSGSARLYALRFGREGYTSLDTGMEATTSWNFGDHYQLEVLAGFSVVNLSPRGLPAEELGENSYLHPRLRFTQGLDYRDSAVLPTRGWHVQLPLEIGTAVGDLNTSYARAGLTGGWYHRLSSSYQIGLGAELGIVVPSGESEELPIELRLFNGGARSVRSFPERELGPSVRDYAVGGEAMWNTNAELIRTLGRTLRGVIFIDAGTLARNYDELTEAEIELALGLGLRLDLPIGPVRLEYGHNLTRDPGEPSGTVHFAIGAAF